MRFNTAQEFTESMLIELGVDSVILDYINANEPELLADNSIMELYSNLSNSGYNELIGINSDEIFNEVLIEYGKQHGRSKGFDMLQLSFEGYSAWQIQELYEVTDEEMLGLVPDVDYWNY